MSGQCCGRDNHAEPASRYSSPPWVINACAECSFVYIDSYPAHEHLAGEMDWETTWAAEDKRRKSMLIYKLDHLTRWRLKLGKQSLVKFIQRYAPSGRVLDLGCGAGNREIADAYEPYGIDISARLAKRANAAFKLRGGYAINAPCAEGLAALMHLSPASEGRFR